LRASLLAAAAVPLALVLIGSTACKTTSTVAFINPSDQPLFVQIDERAPFEVPANGTVHRRLPAVERLRPLTITARNVRGATIFALTTSLPRIEASGSRVEMKATGVPVDPLLQQYPGLP
jgi:hypothetical protein